MRDVSQPIHGVERRLDVRIPVSRRASSCRPTCGCRCPAPDAAAARFPAILEMIPYRKDDWRANGDEARGRYLAARGYALCRLDVRGTGSSPGIALDEYTARETQDGYDAVEWLAAQPWCNGNVGMWGISYGGFTSIQVAALRPPHLKAIVPMYATDDRYTDDVHYVGGCATASELTQYAVSMVGDERPAAAARVPRRGLARTSGASASSGRRSGCSSGSASSATGRTGGRARSRPTTARIEARDPHVRRLDGLVRRPGLPDAGALHARRAGRIVGNWVHEFPDDAYPGPNLDWLHEMVRFFDHWLKGVDNGSRTSRR